MHDIFVLYIGMYIFCCLLEHSIATGYITVIDNKWLFYILFYIISIKMVIIILKLPLVSIVCIIYMNIVLILKMFLIVKFVGAPILIVITFLAVCKVIVNNVVCRSFQLWMQAR